MYTTSLRRIFTSRLTSADHPKSRHDLLFYVICLPLLFYYYFGPYRFIVSIVYIFCLFYCLYSVFLSQKISRLAILIVSAIAFLLIVSSYTFASLYGFLFALRLNFGLFLFLFFFSLIKLPSIQPITLILSFVTIIEFFIIRINHSLISVLPNYDGTFVANEIRGIIGGVHSFGGNRTVTGCILLALFVFLERIQPARRFRFLPLVASLLSYSGLAIFLFFVYFILSNKRRIVRLLPILAILLLLLFLRTQGEFLVPKFNIDYFSFLWDYKLNQIDQLFSINSSILHRLVGLGSNSFFTISEQNADYGSMFGDFAFLDLVSRFGLLGFLIFIVIPFSISTKTSFFPFLILVVSTFHYHVLFSTPGQMVGAYILCYSHRVFIRNRSSYLPVTPM